MPDPRKQQLKSQQKKRPKSAGGSSKKSKKKGKKATSKTSQKLTAKQIKEAMYDPRATLGGDTLRKFVQSQVKMQIRPEIQANKRAVRTLRDLMGKGTQQLRGLEEQSSRNISSYYRDLAGESAKSVATSQALGSRLTGDVGAAAAQGGQAVQQAGEAATARLGADEALRQQAPSAARDQLQAIIAEQQGSAAREGMALKGKAAGQGADWTNMIASMGQAAQMRGGEQMSDAQRDIRNRVTDLQNQYIPDIREALGQIRDTRKTKGALKNQLLAQLRGEEREYLLSKGALGIDKAALKSEAAALASSPTGNPTLDVAKQYGKNKRREQKRSLQNQLAVAEAQGNNKRMEQLRSKLNQLAVIEAQQGGKGAGGGKLAEYDKLDKQRAVNIARGAGSLNFIDLNKQQVIAEMGRRYGVNPVLGRWAVNKILKKYKGSKKQRLNRQNEDFYEAHPL